MKENYGKYSQTESEKEEGVNNDEFDQETTQSINSIDQIQEGNTEEELQEPKVNLSGKTVLVVGPNALTLRKTPSKDTGKIITVLHPETELKVLKEENEKWLKVRHEESSKVGFVMAEYVEVI